LETIGAKFSKEWREVDKRQLYEIGWKKGKGAISFGRGEAKLWFCLLGRVAFVWIWLYSVEDESPSRLFFFWNLAPDLPLCQKCHEGIRRFSVCILGTRTREMRNESRTSCSGSHHLWQFGVLNVNV
jgi:hypothetical protein